MNRFPLLATLLFALPVGCHACATASDSDDPIPITDESALIVWNAKTHTEHFVRRADFETKAKNFGFLVPTPSKPELGTAQDELFDSLERELLPKAKTIVQRGVNWAPFVSTLFAIQGCAGNSGASSETNSVEVVEQKRVGDYHAAVLKASDSRSLLKWLRAHRYTISSDTRQWLVPYIKAGYFLTAFKIVSDVKSESAQARAVRLSFKSETPFYPYREPQRAQKSDGNRSLRVFYVGDNRVEGRIENQGKSGVWSVNMDYSGPLNAHKLRVQGLSVPDGPLRLTAFDDESSPRPGWGDLRFYPASDQSEVVPPPRITYNDKRWWMPLDLLAGGLLFAIGCGARLRKKSPV